MGYRHLFKLQIVILLLILFSCKSGREITRSKKSLSSIEKLADELKKTKVEYKSFKARAKIQFETPELNHSAMLHLRIKKDSIVWGSVTAFLGLEVARFFATGNEVVLIDKFNGVVYKYPYHKIADQYGIADVGLSFIQNFFLGDPLFELDESCRLIKDQDQYRVDKNDDIINRSMFINNLMQVFRYELQHQAQNKNATILYSGIMGENDKYVPGNIMINVNIPESNTMEISYQSINFDKSLKFNTSIPDNYEIIE